MSKNEIKHCQVCEGGVLPLTDAEVNKHLADLPDWQYDSKLKRISKQFKFKGYLRTISFVNAIAWMANTENHHPDLEVSYNTCTVHYQTHAVSGVTENDLLCASKIEELLL